MASIFIKGPISAMPKTANIGDKFWDQDSNITYTYTASGWINPIAPVAEISESAPAPAPKRTRAKKTE